MIASASKNIFSFGSDYRSCFLNSNGNNFKDLVLSMKRREYDVMNQIHISDVFQTIYRLYNVDSCGYYYGW